MLSQSHICLSKTSNNWVTGLSQYHVLQQETKYFRYLACKKRFLSFWSYQRWIECIWSIFIHSAILYISQHKPTLYFSDNISFPGICSQAICGTYQFEDNDNVIYYIYKCFRKPKYKATINPKMLFKIYVKFKTHIRQPRAGFEHKVTNSLWWKWHPCSYKKEKILFWKSWIQIKWLVNWLNKQTDIIIYYLYMFIE